MITKWKYIVTFVVISIGLYCCGSEKRIRQQAIKDIYGRPISFLLDDNRDIYYLEDGKRIIAYLRGVEFNGGRDSLSKYLLTKYVNHPSYNYMEYNIYEYFFILFNKNIEIKEVRIMYRKYNDNKRYYYDSIFVDALKNTSGMWHKTTEDKEWYIYFHRQRIY
jgi:hypothetical protein